MTGTVVHIATDGDVSLPGLPQLRAEKPPLHDHWRTLRRRVETLSDHLGDITG